MVHAAGIDQVNQALTLRFIEHFPLIKLIQVAENCEPAILEFPRKFLHNLTRAKAREMARYFRFSQVRSLNLSGDPEINSLADLGDTLMRLDHSSLVSMSFKEPWLSLRKRNSVVKRIFETWVEKPDPQKMNMWLYLTVKANEYCSNTEELVWRLFALYEQILKPYVSKKINWGNTTEDFPFTSFNSCIERNRDLLDYLRQKKYNQKTLVPGAKIFGFILKFYNSCLPGEVESILKVLGSVQDKRNMLVHQGRGISKIILNAIFSEHQTNIEDFMTGYLDPYFGVKDFGLIGDLRSEIISRL